MPSRFERLRREEKLSEPKSPQGRVSRWSNGSSEVERFSDHLEPLRCHIQHLSDYSLRTQKHSCCCRQLSVGIRNNFVFSFCPKIKHKYDFIGIFGFCV